MKIECRIAREQHGEMATACAWLPSGNEIITCSDDKVIKRMETDQLSSDPVTSLNGFPTDLAYCPSVNDKHSDTIAITFADGNFRILQATSGREEKKVQAYTAGAAISLAWNHEGTAIATGGEDGVVKVWSRVGMLRNTVATMRHPVYCVVWGRDDALLFSSGKLLTIEQKQRKQIQWKAHDGTILCVDWNPVNNLIVSGGEDCKYRVWDANGRQLFASTPSENVITSVAWAPNGLSFAVGSFGLLKVCDRTGWTQCREDLKDTGSVLKLNWTGDSALVAGSCASGAVVVAEITQKVIEWKHTRALLVDLKQIEVQDSLQDQIETLAFRDRIVDVSLEYGYLLVATCAPQVHIYNLNDLKSPTIIDLNSTGCSSSVLVQAQKCFLAGWTVYTYEGRRVATSQCLSGININVLDKNTVALNDRFMSVVESSRDAIRLIDLGKGKPIAVIKHKLEIVQLAMGEDDLLAFVDANGDLFVQVTGKKTFKLPTTMVESIKFNESGALVAACDGGNKLQVVFFPGVVWVDPDLLSDTMVTVETPNLASKQPRILSFTDNMVTLREHTGSVVSCTVSRYPALLHELVKNRKWEDAIRLCRFVDQQFLWAFLAARALDKCHLDSAEIGLASLQNVAKLNYILYIKDLPSEKARMAELALFKRDVKSAESILLQAHPPMFYRAIKMNVRMHRWERAKQICNGQRDFLRIVELYEKQWKQQKILSSSELKELKSFKQKYSDRDIEDDDEEEEDSVGDDEQQPQNDDQDDDEISRRGGGSGPIEGKSAEGEGDQEQNDDDGDEDEDEAKH